MQLETRTDTGAQPAELTLADIKVLCAAQPPCLTISMPVFGSPDQARQNPVRLRQMLGQAKEALAAHGVDEKTIAAMLDGITLSTEDLNAPEGKKGLLIFRNATDVYRYAFVPDELQEAVQVGDHFVIKTLLPNLKGDRTFYILALSQKHVRLLRCTDHSSEEVPLPEGVPTSKDEAMQTRKPAVWTRALEQHIAVQVPPAVA